MSVKRPEQSGTELAWVCSPSRTKSSFLRQLFHFCLRTKIRIGWHCWIISLFLLGSHMSPCQLLGLVDVRPERTSSAPGIKPAPQMYIITGTLVSLPSHLQPTLETHPITTGIRFTTFNPWLLDWRQVTPEIGKDADPLEVTQGLDRHWDT